MGEKAEGEMLEDVDRTGVGRRFAGFAVCRVSRVVFGCPPVGAEDWVVEDSRVTSDVGEMPKADSGIAAESFFTVSRAGGTIAANGIPGPGDCFAVNHTVKICFGKRGGIKTY